MKKIKTFLLLFCFLLIASMCFSQKTGSISGYVLDALTKKPLQSASIRIPQLNQSTITDAAGRYQLKNIKVGSYTLEVSFTGYQAETKFNISVTSGNENEISFEIQPLYSTTTEVVVVANRKTARTATLETPLSVQRLTAEEIKTNPGGNFDISRVINSLPGVGGSSGSVGGFRNDILIRGGGPGENVFYLDGIEIPVINHFATQGSGGGPTGILNVSFIEDVKLSTSSFDAKYDNALSSIFEFKQKTGNPNKTQGNLRLSGTELAATLEGPVNNKLTYLLSVRRSYLQLLFSMIDLPIRPNYWDFQYKLTYKPDTKSTLTFLGVGAIDQFGFGTIKTPTQDKLYTINQVPFLEQKSYAIGASYRRSLANGFMLLSLSRNALDNYIEKNDFNDDTDPANLRYKTNAKETENKLRLEVNKNLAGFKISYGAVTQYLQYNTQNNIRRRAAVGTQPEIRFLFSSDLDFFRLGAFAQVGKKFFDNRLGFNAGIRTDINTFSTEGSNPLHALSPRIALSYVLADKWTINATIGRYAKIAPYTILGFRDNNNQLVNKSSNYITNTHYVTGIEYLPKATTRFTLEGFYKKYNHVPVTVSDGVSINNLGADFGAVGNEPVTPVGIGESYGLEFFAQQKLTKRFFGILSYTGFQSRFSNADGKLAPSAWDTRHLLSATMGYKLGKSWEFGLKYRYQGGAPYTPFDLAASQQNFLTQGQGILNYSRFNSLRLSSFSSSDIRIDKKWNFKKITLDLFLDVSNWWGAKSVSYPQYSFERNLTTQNFNTTDGLAIKPDGSNAIPIILKNEDPVVLPTIGFIIAF